MWVFYAIYLDLLKEKLISVPIHVISESIKEFSQGLLCVGLHVQRFIYDRNEFFMAW